VNLGKTELKVSKLGFGTFDFGVPSLNISPKEGGRILFESYKLGVNFWDASDDYGSHPHVASALKLVPRKRVVISTKTSAKSGEEAEKSLETSLKELDTDYIDIFLLHYVKSDWIDGCHQVLKELNGVKTTGMVKAIGLSTHSVKVAKEASRFEELDVIMTICCKANQATINRFRDHIPLEDGSIEEMVHAIRLAHTSGKGIIAMKVLGGLCPRCQLSHGLQKSRLNLHPAPPLIKDYQASINTIANMGFVDSMVVGMKNIDQVKKNINAVVSD